VFELIRDINTAGTAVLFATHNLDLVRRNAGYRVIELDHGNIVFDSAANGAG
jgi:ABC-type ATPase involved in cell division